MARQKTAKGKPARKQEIAGLDTATLHAPMLNANDGRGGHALSQARKTAVKKAFGLLTRKR